MSLRNASLACLHSEARAPARAFVHLERVRVGDPYRVSRRVRAYRSLRRPVASQAQRQPGLRSRRFRPASRRGQTVRNMVLPAKVPVAGLRNRPVRGASRLVGEKGGPAFTPPGTSRPIPNSASSRTACSTRLLQSTGSCSTSGSRKPRLSPATIRTCSIGEYSARPSSGWMTSAPWTARRRAISS